MWERIKELEEFYIEFQKYAKAKISLQDKKKEDCPKSCLAGYEAREKIIEDFEKKYLTNK